MRLCWQSVSLLVALFILCKVVQGVLLGRLWPSFDWFDIGALMVLGLAVSAVAAYTCGRAGRALDSAERQRRQVESLVAENDAAMRVVRAVAREFAQPLSGALGYSEMLMMRADTFTGYDRQELEGLREGVLQLEGLLKALCQAADTTPALGGSRHIAEDVERSVAAPRPRLPAHAAASSAGTTGASEIA